MYKIPFFALLIVSCSVVAAPMGHLEVWSGDENKIIIEDGVVVREVLPRELFSINLNYRSFERQLWDEKENKVLPGIIENLEPLGLGFYRYPGGLVANSFMWEGSLGPIDNRTDQKTIFNAPPGKATFGLAEYLKFLGDVKGQFFYVMNVVGADSRYPLNQSQKEKVAQHNASLAKYLVEQIPDQKRYYQLGNELDRGKYEWSPDKYVERSKATMDAVREVDQSAIFVAFMRDFNLKAKSAKASGGGQSKVFLNAVMKGMPEIKDYSLHHYYDGHRSDGKSRTVTFWMRLLRNSIKDYQAIRGEDPNIWITEHGRQMSSNRAGSDNTVHYTSNLGGAVSTADYLIMIAQVPQVKGAVWHGLNAGPWQLFDATVKHKDLRPRPIYYGFKVLRGMDLPQVLKTRTTSKNISDNLSGYDVRAVAFSDRSNSSLGLWVVNHASVSQEVTVKYSPYQSKSVTVNHEYISGPKNIDADDLSLQFDESVKTASFGAEFTPKKTLKLMLPPSSVSTFKITPSGAISTQAGATELKEY